MDKDKIFRKVAIDRLSSPEQLDQKIEVLPPKSWFALLSFCLLFVSTLVWGIQGQLHVTVEGVGIFMYGDGISTVINKSSGVITNISYDTGEYVERGQVIARISQTELIEELKILEENLHSLQYLDDDLKDVSKMSREMYDIFSPYILKILYPETESTKLEAEQAMEDLKEIYTVELEEKVAYQQMIVLDKSQILAESSGQILEINYSIGDTLYGGENFCSMANVDENNMSQEVILYVSSTEGKKIEEGMTVNVYPSTVNQEEYGYIVGLVREISTYPVSLESIENTVSNEQLVSLFSENIAPLEVKIELLHNKDTISGYQWSTEHGAPVSIDPGVICTADVRVNTIRPIDLVIPYL